MSYCKLESRGSLPARREKRETLKECNGRGLTPPINFLPLFRVDPPALRVFFRSFLALLTDDDELIAYA